MSAMHMLPVSFHTKLCLVSTRISLCLSSHTLSLLYIDILMYGGVYECLTHVPMLHCIIFVCVVYCEQYPKRFAYHDRCIRVMVVNSFYLRCTVDKQGPDLLPLTSEVSRNCCHPVTVLAHPPLREASRSRVSRKLLMCEILAWPGHHPTPCKIK